MTHVLEVESTKYAEHIASGGDEILVGCVCGRCGGRNLEVTQSWVRRGLQLVGGEYSQLAVVLAICLDCKKRERVLPCDVLPGKVNGVANIYGAIAEVRRRATLTAAAKRAGVTRQCVRNWIRGVAHRYLDLARLFRHRAMVAPSDAAAQRTLVMFWAFIAQARIEQPTLSWPAAPPPPVAAAREVVVAASAMVALLDNASGAAAVAEVGAKLFRQSVLLFRSRGVSTPSSGPIFGDFEDDGRCPKRERHAKEKPRPKGSRLLGRCCMARP